MTKVLISWKGINARISADPKEAIKQKSFLLQMAQLTLKDENNKNKKKINEICKDVQLISLISSWWSTF